MSAIEKQNPLDVIFSQVGAKEPDYPKLVTALTEVMTYLTGQSDKQFGADRAVLAGWKLTTWEGKRVANARDSLDPVIKTLQQYADEIVGLNEEHDRTSVIYPASGYARFQVLWHGGQPEVEIVPGETQGQQELAYLKSINRPQN